MRSGEAAPPGGELNRDLLALQDEAPVRGTDPEGAVDLERTKSSGALSDAGVDDVPRTQGEDERDRGREGETVAGGPRRLGVSVEEERVHPTVGDLQADSATGDVLDPEETDVPETDPDPRSTLEEATVPALIQDRARTDPQREDEEDPEGGEERGEDHPHTPPTRDATQRRSRPERPAGDREVDEGVREGEEGEGGATSERTGEDTSDTPGERGDLEHERTGRAEPGEGVGTGTTARGAAREVRQGAHEELPGEQERTSPEGTRGEGPRTLRSKGSRHDKGAPRGRDCTGDEETPRASAGKGEGTTVRE